MIVAPDGLPSVTMLRWHAGLLLALASGCSSPTHLEDLQAPALLWTQDRGLCSKIAAVDGEAGVWSEQGCENGRPELDRLRTASATEIEELRSAFASLPFDQRSALFTECGGRLLHQFAEVDPPGGRSTAACGGSATYDDVSGLPDPFRALAGAFLRVRRE
jgi:hypothetical protein